MYNNDDKKNSESSDFDYYPESRRSSKKIWIISISFLLIAVVILYIAIYNPGIFKKHNPVVTTEEVKSDSTQTVIPDSLSYNSSDYASLDIPNKDNKFHIIAGVFVIEKNANNYMEELKSKGFDPKIVLKRGEYNFISIFSFPNFKEANSKYKSIDGIPIWIMKY